MHHNASWAQWVWVNWYLGITMYHHTTYSRIIDNAHTRGQEEVSRGIGAWDEVSDILRIPHCFCKSADTLARSRHKSRRPLRPPQCHIAMFLHLHLKFAIIITNQIYIWVRSIFVFFVSFVRWVCQGGCRGCVHPLRELTKIL